MDELIITGDELTIADVVRVARSKPGALSIRLDEKVYARVAASRKAVEQIVSEERIAYSINTGFGAFQNCLISRDALEALQRNLVLSHSVGVGAPLSQGEVRALILIRANVLAKGYSGVRLKVIELLLNLLNLGVEPLIPQQGSLGCSGDLAQLSHLALVLIGEGLAKVGSEVLSGSEALAKVGLEPLTLKAKEGLALLNGTAAMCAVGCLVVADAIETLLGANVTSALTLEALSGIEQSLEPRLHLVRPHSGQINVARFLRALLRESELISQPGVFRVQDAYSLRCIPQIHGAVHDVLAHVRAVLETEINSATDNPLIFVEENSIDVVSCGNFHGEAVALAMDYLTLALTELGNVSERRLNRLLDPACNNGLLPTFLSEHYKLVREQIPFFDQDVFMQPYLLRARELILEGLVSKTVRQTLPNEFTIGKNPDEQNL